MGGGNDLDPLAGGDATGGDAAAELVVEDFGGGAGEGIDAGLFEGAEVVLDRAAGADGAVEDLLRGEGVDMDVGEFSLDGAGEVDVVVAVHLGGKAGLDAHLGGAQIPGLAGTADDFFDGEEVGLLLAMVAREGAEAAVLDADVGEVDVAVDDVGHHVPHAAAPQLVGCEDDGVDLWAPGLEQRRRFVNADVFALQGLV